MADLHNPTAFRAKRQRRLALAVMASLVLHALVFSPAPWRLATRSGDIASIAPPIEARLLPPPAELIAPAVQTPATSVKPIPTSPVHASVQAAPATTAQANTAARQVSEHLYYPAEAIARGLEGEAQVLLFLDETGNAIAARLEHSSGHAMLDEAALQAARAVRAVPAQTPREVLLPVRFRLR